MEWVAKIDPAKKSWKAFGEGIFSFDPVVKSGQYSQIIG
jgi:hypothetical protein